MDCGLGKRIRAEQRQKGWDRGVMNVVVALLFVGVGGGGGGGVVVA